MTLPKKLLAATDFSESADRACEVAMTLADRFEAELHWVHSGEHLPGKAAPSGLPLLTRYVEEANRAARERLEEWVARARARGLTSEAHLVDPPVEEGVTQLARRIGADCVVCGSRGRSTFRRLWLGSVAEGIVRRAPCRVLVDRGEGPHAAGGTVLLGDDLTPYSKPARDDATGWARCLGGRVEVVHSIDLGIPYLSSVEVVVPGNLLKETSAEAHAKLAEESKGAPDVEITDHVVGEKPVAALCELAERLDAGLIVVGTHSRGSLDRWVLGSVAEGVVRRAPCSVLVVPPGLPG